MHACTGSFLLERMFGFFRSLNQSKSSLSHLHKCQLQLGVQRQTILNEKSAWYFNICNWDRTPNPWILIPSPKYSAINFEEEYQGCVQNKTFTYVHNLKHSIRSNAVWDYTGTCWHCPLTSCKLSTIVIQTLFTQYTQFYSLHAPRYTFVLVFLLLKLYKVQYIWVNNPGLLYVSWNGVSSILVSHCALVRGVFHFSFTLHLGEGCLPF